MFIIFPSCIMSCIGVALCEICCHHFLVGFNTNVCNATYIYTMYFVENSIRLVSDQRKNVLFQLFVTE